jgi:hypothetical protein
MLNMVGISAWALVHAHFQTLLGYRSWSVMVIQYGILPGETGTITGTTAPTLVEPDVDPR